MAWASARERGPYSFCTCTGCVIEAAVAARGFRKQRQQTDFVEHVFDVAALVGKTGVRSIFPYFDA
jgi:hypothetical protein